MDNKYQRAKVYKIISQDTDKIYIGSTIVPTLAQRLAKHIADYGYYKVGKRSFISSFEIIKYPDYKIVLLESFPCNSRDELLAREQHHIDIAGDSCVNMRKAYITLSEEEYVKQYNKEYNILNKDKIDERNKTYREENKDKIQEIGKQYYKQNREEIRAKRAKKIECDCGVLFSQSYKLKHYQSFIHTEYEKMLQ